MKITLRIEGKGKVFTNDFVSGRMLRKAIEITKTINLNDIDGDALDQIVDFVVGLYGNQFTRDEFYDGIDARVMLKTIMDEINGVIEGTSKAVGVDPEDPNL